MKKTFYSSKTSYDFSPEEFAYHIINKFGIVSVSGEERLYARDECGVSRSITKIGIGQYINRELKAEGIKNEISTIQKITYYVELNAPTIKHTDFNERNLILFKNGVLNVETDEFVDKIPDGKYFTNYTPFNYKPIPDTPIVFEKFLNDLSNCDEDMKKLLYEIIGVVISNYPGYLSKKAFLLIGPGNTGKSKYRDLLTKFVDDNSSAINFALLDKRFSMASVFNKRVVGSADTSYMNIGSITQFKLLTGGDDVDVEFKGKDSFNSGFYGLLVFCSNKYPLFSGDKGEHVYERLCIIPCDNVIPVEKRDALIFDKMLAEGDDIVSIAVQYLKQWINRGFVFTYPERCKEALKEYKVRNSPELMFYEECCVLCDKNSNPYKAVEIYDAFVEWCKRNCPDYKPSSKIFEETLADELRVPDINCRTSKARTYIFTLKEH